MEFYTAYQPQFTYCLQPETVFPLQNELAPPKLIPNWMCKASKPQTSGLFQVQFHVNSVCLDFYMLSMYVHLFSIDGFGLQIYIVYNIQTEYI